MQSISPNHNWENGVKQIRLLKKIRHKSCNFCQLLRTKTLASGSKCIKHYFCYFYHCLPYVSWINAICLTYNVFLKCSWCLVWIYCAPLSYILNQRSLIRNIIITQVIGIAMAFYPASIFTNLLLAHKEGNWVKAQR